MPTSLAEAMALRHSDAFGAKRNSGRAARLALATDLYHKLKARCSEENPRRRAFDGSTIHAAAKNAWKRLGAL